MTLRRFRFYHLMQPAGQTLLHREKLSLNIVIRHHRLHRLGHLPHLPPQRVSHQQKRLLKARVPRLALTPQL